MESIDEHTPLEIRIEYVKAFQELNRAYESLVTYDDYNDDMVKSPTLNNQHSTFGRNKLACTRP